MADPKPVHAGEYYIKTSSTAPSGSDALTWVRSLSLDITRTVKEETYLGNEWATAQVTSGNVTGTLEVDLEAGGTIHELFIDYGPLGTTNAGVVVYITVYDNPSAASTVRKGWTFPVKIHSTAQNFVGTDVVQMTVNFSGNGAPIEVVAA